jgi:hypothetical protein
VEFRATVFRTTHIGQGPSGGIDTMREGPWELDVLARTSSPNIPPWTLEAGDWNDLTLSAEFSSPAEPAYIDAIFVRDGDPPVDVHISFDESLLLSLDLQGQSKLDAPLSFTVNDKLHPLDWFPNINLTNLAADADGVIQLRPAENEVVYAQVVDALEKSANDWLDP